MDELLFKRESCPPESGIDKMSSSASPGPDRLDCAMQEQLQEVECDR